MLLFPDKQTGSLKVASLCKNDRKYGMYPKLLKYFVPNGKLMVFGVPVFKHISMFICLKTGKRIKLS